MHPRPAAIVAWLIALAPAALGAEPLSLEQAFARVTAAHPELRLIESRRESLSAERDGAALAPAPRVGATLENALGTGESSEFESAELTLSLASRLERGDKRAARTALADRRIDALATESEARRLDLLAEVARRYLAIVAAQRQEAIAARDLADRERALGEARTRFRAGAAPESQLLAAEAAAAQARLDLHRAQRAATVARTHLAALWSGRDAAFSAAAPDLLELPEVPDLAALEALIDASPGIARFASEQRILEARLQLARSEAAFDVEWDVGVRRLEASDDFALVAGISVPLGASRRAQPGIRAAQAELASIEIAREAEAAALYATLVEAHGRLETASLEVQGLRTEVIPRLDRAAAASERAWRAGAAGYVEWSQLQGESIAARGRQVQAALEARRALIEIQRLTGSAFAQAPRQADTARSP